VPAGVVQQTVVEPAAPPSARYVLADPRVHPTAAVQGLGHAVLLEAS